MRQFKAFLFILLAVVIQTVVFSRLTVYGAGFDLIITAVIVWGLLQGAVEGLWAGLVFGVFMDVLCAPGRLFFTIAMALVGAGSGLVREKVFKEQEEVLLASVFILSLAGYLFMSWALHVQGIKTVVHFWPAALISSAMNILVAPVLKASITKVAGYERQ